MLVDIDQGNTAHTAVEVHQGLFFDKDVSLRTESIPSYIHVYFEPKILKPVFGRSTLKIRTFFLMPFSNIH
jgi:hypothetical protein